MNKSSKRVRFYNFFRLLTVIKLLAAILCSKIHLTTVKSSVKCFILPFQLGYVPRSFSIIKNELPMSSYNKRNVSTNAIAFLC